MVIGMNRRSTPRTPALDAIARAVRDTTAGEWWVELEITNRVSGRNYGDTEAKAVAQAKRDAKSTYPDAIRIEVKSVRPA